MAVLVGELPADFLRVTSSAEQRQIAADRQTAAYLQAGGAMPVFAPASRFSITVAQARLNKNYGLTKMDPYCRVRVGHAVFETHTSASGGKMPVWNKVIYAALPPGVNTFCVEIFDERSFTMDDRVAWTHVTIPERVMKGETVDDWYPLSGKMGDEKEGTINLVLSYAPAPPVQRVMYTAPMYAPMYGQPTAQPMVVMAPGGVPAPVYYGGYPSAVPANSAQPPPAAQPVTDEDVAVVKDMFPDVEVEVIKSVLEANRGDKDATINNLLAMQSS